MFLLYLIRSKGSPHSVLEEQVSSPIPVLEAQVSSPIPDISHLVSHSSSSDKEGGQRFVLGLNYWEQFNMAVANFFKLTCLAEQWNARTVLPFTFNSRLYGLQYFKADENENIRRPALNLSLIYNISSLNRILRKHHIPPTVHLQDFLRQSGNELTVIHFIPNKEVHEIPVLLGKTKVSLQEAFKHDNVVDCRYHLRQYTGKLMQALTTESSHHDVEPRFHLSRYFCVNMSVLTTPQALASRVGIDPSGNFSVIIVNWRGTQEKDFVISSAKGAHTNKRISMSNVCREPVSLTYDNLIAHSDIVLAATERYMEHLKLGEFVGVHIRSEKLGEREPRLPGSFRKCFMEMLRILNEVLLMQTNLTVVYLTDMGPYKTDSCKNCKAGKQIQQLSEEHGLRPVSFEPHLVGSPDDSGFSAAVEMNLLASAKFLVVCGGGAFQNQAVLRFLQHSSHSSPHERLFHACTDNPSVAKLMGTSITSHS